MYAEKIQIIKKEVENALMINSYFIMKKKQIRNRQVQLSKKIHFIGHKLQF